MKEGILNIEGKQYPWSYSGASSDNESFIIYSVPNFIVGTLRKLTPVECERLQTLPDHYTESIPTNQRYTCLGNGWTVDVIAHILKGMEENNAGV